MRIVHLSDLHFNPLYDSENIIKTTLFLENALKEGFDHLTISGDIAHNADTQSFEIFRNMLKEYDLLDSKKATITIGNHDIFGGVFTVKDLFGFPERCRMTDYDKSVSVFISHFEELFLDCYFPSKDSIFPFAKILGDKVIIGINTNDIYSRVKNPFASNGKVTNSDYENLLKIFNLESLRNKDKIILGHHHFYKNSFEAKSSNNELWNKIEGYTLKLRGKKKLLKLFKRNNVKLLLHGHSHENKHYNRMGIDIYNSAGSIDNDFTDRIFINKIFMQQNTIDIVEREISVPLKKDPVPIS
jgi:3',5'-cyclic AMP phosphodiesterase CpdA